MRLMLDELEQKLDEYNYAPSKRFLTISMVPAHPRSFNTPNYVSIGPHHREKSKLRREAEKASFLRQLLEMAQNDVPSLRQLLPTNEPCIRDYLEHLANEVKQLLEQNNIEEYYGLNWRELEKSALVEVMLLDGCYLIAYYGQVGKNEQPPGQRSQVTGQGSAANHQLNDNIVPGSSGGSSTERVMSSRITIRSLLSSSGNAGSHQASSPPTDQSPPPGITELELMGSQAPGQHQPPLTTGVQSLSSSSTTEQEPNGQSVRGSSSGPQQPPSTEDSDPFWPDLVRDTWYLLENQMPFIVVAKIYGITTGGTEMDVRKAFTNFARKLLEDRSYISRDSTQQAGSSDTTQQDDSWFRSFQQQLHSKVTGLRHLRQCLGPFPVISNQAPPSQALDGANSNEEPSSQGPSHHLLDLLHTLLKPKKKPDESDKSKIDRWRRATEYVRWSNVRFVRRNLDGHQAGSVLDVDLKGCDLHIPRLLIDGTTWTILYNLMALERQHPSLGTYVTDYCLFMSQLACTAEDVELLLRDDVIDHSLGDPKNVAAGFGDLCRGVVYDSEKNYLKPISRKLEKRYRNPWHNFWSWFRVNYWSCKNLPVVIALIVTTAVLISDVVSAVYQTRSYYQQLHDHM